MADEGKKVGVITHFYDKIGVGIVKLDSSIKLGDKLKFSGHDREFEQPVGQMQFDHKDIEEAKKGQEVGIKLDNKVKEGDQVFLAS
ncbi:MAG: translation elongation factor-like protein [Patescibacteria group bacterium]